MCCSRCTRIIRIRLQFLLGQRCLKRIQTVCEQLNVQRGSKLLNNSNRHNLHSPLTAGYP